MTDQPQLSLNLPDTQPLTTVEGYQFEPIKGYPMLHWKGKRPFTSTQYYPAQLKEVHGTETEGWRSKIYWGDNLQVMSHLLKEFRGKVNLVYIDPPFDSKADYKKRIKLKGESVSNDLNAFEEKQYTDIWTNDEYLQFLYERLIIIRELLSDDGSIFIHCDWRKNSHLRCLMDEIFSSGNFITEIVWKRATTHAQRKGFAIVHDSILNYSKGSDYVWNSQYIPHEKEYVDKYYNNFDQDGRRYTLDNLTAEGQGQPRFFFGIQLSPPPGTHWRYSQEKIDEYCKTGLIVLTSNDRPRFKRYLDTLKGKIITSFWDDINPVNSQAIEDTKYPTQKPKDLLERIIKSSSNPGDIVFDCFMGSGTTQAVAMKLGRRFIGADINLGAVQITTKRLLGVAEELEQAQVEPAKVLQLSIPKTAPALRSIAGGNAASAGGDRRAAESGATYAASENTEDTEDIESAVDQDAEPTTYYTGFEVYNVNHYDVFRNPLEAKDLLLEALEVNRLGQGNLFDGEKDGRMVKIMPVNRITTRADLNELIAGFDYKAFEKRYQEHPHAPVEKITLVCMGHEPDLAFRLKQEVKPFELDVEVIDILRDRQEIQFKRDSEASITVQGKDLVIEAFYPMNLLGKLSLQQENVEDWRELVESVMIDWNFDGAIFQPLQVDIPGKNELVSGRYPIPDDAGTIRIKITDLLSESLEVELEPD
ncbi:site-specific DNA-methyltransferase [Stenomitos frigidus]|uniref:Site-specific DNA-methyltransferase n=1 Tax=Stenomitos frigidus ULC18 TaxID=2107698 RepID=A0A2T1DXW7_9CYAN|nr:site-specific DNA-methyltransferase [Stenomitos frigidus]PSB25356.1 site-specific DNA-methyltransferase [Stenomitos frigidus ULC18]